MIIHGYGHGGVDHYDGLLNPFGAKVEKTIKITEVDKYSKAN